jgi:hypothetical protein
MDFIGPTKVVPLLQSSHRGRESGGRGFPGLKIQTGGTRSSDGDSKKGRPNGQLFVGSQMLFAPRRAKLKANS